MFRTRGSSIEAPGTGSVAWVTKGNKIIFDFVYLWANRGVEWWGSSHLLQHDEFQVEE